MKTITAPSWPQLFSELSENEKKVAVFDFLQTAYDPEKKNDHQKALLIRFAKTLKYRPESLRKTCLEVQVTKLLLTMRSFFEPSDWSSLLANFYEHHRHEIMVEFLDYLSIPHNGRGMLLEEAEPVEVQTLVEAGRLLRRNHSFTNIKHYFFVAYRTGTKLFSNIPEVLLILKDDEPEEVTSTAPEPSTSLTQPPDQALLLDDFTTLDRVMIDQIVAMVGHEEGCLDITAVEDLIETVVALNTTRTRSYYLLGFLDGLEDGRDLQFHRPELNDERKGWYLAGLLVAKTRKKDQVALCGLLDKYAKEFSDTVQRPQGAGVAITNVCLDYLFEIQRFREAMAILKGQLGRHAFRLAVRAYEQATRYWRDNQVDSALPILNLLLERLPAIEYDEEHKEYLLNMVYRRQGQCLQTQHDFDQARKIYLRILNHIDSDIAPKLYADLGLIEGGFRNLEKVRLSADPTERKSMRKALTQGEKYFLQAIELSQEIAINANYALGLRDYLAWADGDSKPKMRAQALSRIENALIGMRESTEYAAYEKIGVFGQAQFMRVVLSMDMLSPEESYKLLAYWEAIPKESGLFPPKDVKNLLLGAEIINPGIAAEIANSIWRMRTSADAWSIIDSSLPTILRHSDYLQSELLKEARAEKNPRAQRIEIWMYLIPTFIKLQKNDLAEEGLDALELLVEESERANTFLHWLGNSNNFDPIWSQTEADWARLRIARKLGREGEYANLLNDMFFRNRDDDPIAAEQIVHLMVEWKVLEPKRAKALIGTLHTETAAEIKPGLDKRLVDGEPVNILFIGGNEIQAQYDEAVRSSIKRQWAGCDITFEHTGWSSNWGRMVDSLVLKGNASDAVVIMPMMRTLLGRTVRNKLTKPWIPCTRLGRDGILDSIRQAALIGLQQRDEG